MTPAEHMAAWEKRNKERWVGLTCPVFYGKPEDIPARFRHYPFMVATITVKGLEEAISASKEKTQGQ
jgi:hypothetical protein